MSKATGIPVTVLTGDLLHQRATGIPGAIFYGTYAAVPDSRMLFSCPCGCGTISNVLIRPFEGQVFHHNSGTKDRPTINPFIGITRHENDPDIEADGYHWHGTIVDGVWESR